MSRIYEIFGTNAHAMTRALMESAGAACKIPSGASVALKPNLVVAASPETGATTHAGVLSGAIEYLRDHGFRDISIIEGSWVGDDTGRAFRAAGYEAVGKKYGVPLFDLKRDKTRRVDTPLRPMDICCRALDADYLINLPVLKGHCQTAMTCALKNCKGCLPDREKRRFHAEGLMRPIAALAAALRPELTIVDSLCGDLDFEDGGNPVVMNRVMAACDPVLVDAYVCQMMHYEVAEVPYVKLAGDLGVGCSDISKADVRFLEDGADQRMPVSRKVVELADAVEEVESCSACYGYLIPALEMLKEERLFEKLDEKICIGQGYRGKTGVLGVGHCTCKFQNYVEGCPPLDGDIYEFLKGYIGERTPGK